MRVLVTGSRDWDDVTVIEKAMDAFVDVISAGLGGYGEVTLVSGACPTGTDRVAENLATHIFGWSVERHPADWNRHGKRAGFIRNAEMVELGADICFAFIKNNSRGASHTASLAEAAGIPVGRFEATT